MAFKSFNRFCFAAFLIFLSVVSPCSAAEAPTPMAAPATCNSYRFSSLSAKTEKFESCSDLPVLSSFIHWTFYPSTLTADIAFRKTGTSPESWVAWCLNPTGQSMLGCQCLVAFLNPQGVPTAFTTQITSYSPSMQNGNLTFGVSILRADYSNGEMIIFATLQLDASLVKTNQIWQEGPMSGGTTFGMHSMSSANQRSVGTIDFSTGATTAGSASPQSNKFKNVHGVLNAVSWGVMMPAGVMMARYLKAFQIANPAWFHLHRACQTLAYVVGVAGVVTGILLGNGSPGITHRKHRILGITLLCCASLQVLALMLRPKPEHKFRLLWNIYHRLIGYATIVMSIINVYEGLHLLQADPIWTKIYTGIVIAMGVAAVVLELFMWLKICYDWNKTKSDVSSAVNA